MSRLARPLGSATRLVASLLDAPELVAVVRALDPGAFAAVVRRVGVEDAGELVAVASTAQLVAAFDEDLFRSDRPGEREVFDVARFVTWLEVLLEAGDEAVADRFAALSEDFVVRALSSVILVLDHDALLARLGEDDRDARMADKALEGALTEEIDGYLLVARRHEGWDAALALVLALDRGHRALLERVLDRAAALASAYVDDLEALTDVLSNEDALAEDVEAEREERRSRAGYVEPRAARAFLGLAAHPIAGDLARAPRDAITRAYFRELAPSAPGVSGVAPRTARAWIAAGATEGAVSAVTPSALRLGAASSSRAPSARPQAALAAAMRALREEDPRAFAERVEELGYLVNVVVAGEPSADGERLDAAAAADRVLAEVARGARRHGRSLLEALRACHADVLFRAGRSAPRRAARSLRRGA